MTTREARIGLITFGLLFAALAVKLLAYQAPPPAASARIVPDRTSSSARKAVEPPRPEAVRPSASSGKSLESEGAETVRAVQRELRVRGYETGATDGVATLMTRAAVMAFEFDHRLSLTAEAGEDTLRRILLGDTSGERTRPGAHQEQRPNVLAVVRAVQEMLAGLGYNPGRTDGIFSLETQQAVRAFEKASGLPVTGRISGPLVAKLGKGAETRTAPAR